MQIVRVGVGLCLHARLHAAVMGRLWCALEMKTSLYCTGDLIAVVKLAAEVDKINLCIIVVIAGFCSCKSLSGHKATTGICSCLNCVDVRCRQGNSESG